MNLAMTILIAVVAAGLTAAATVLALNQLFAVGIPHSFLSYANIIFLMLLIRFLVTPSSEAKKMQVRKQ